jgi:N-acetylglucosamine-6-sulfatase
MSRFRMVLTLLSAAVVAALILTAVPHTAGITPSSASAAEVPGPAAARAPAGAPNVLLLIADDQAPAMFSRTTMPTVFRELVDQGVRFDKAYVNSAICCASRAQMFTGLHEAHTGVDSNSVKLTRPTIFQALHDWGYRTGMAGKYLNSESCTVPHPEFDFRACQQHGAPSGLTLQDPTLYVNGTWKSHVGWTPQIEAEYLADFIADTPVNRPFFALYTPTSPHLPANDLRYQDMAVPAYAPASRDEDTRTSGKPFYMQREPLDAAARERNERRYEAMSRAVRGLDDSIKTLLDAIEGRADNTIVFYISDNGFLLGEHQRVAKQLPYEEASHMPFVVRYPAVVPRTAPFRSPALVQNIDIPATVMELAGFPWGADGRSLMPLLRRQATSIRNAALVNWCTGASRCPGGRNGNNAVEPQKTIPTYRAAVDQRYKYVEYVTGEKELYDLQTDPQEMINRAGRSDHATVQQSMAATLAQLTREPPPQTTIVTGPRGTTSGRQATFLYFTQSRTGTYTCRLTRNGVAGAWTACNGGSFTYPGLTDAAYRFQVRGRTPAGVQDTTPATRSFTVRTG